jgi:multiple antibiotic resistance protein
MHPKVAITHLLRDLPTATVGTFLALFPIVNPLGGIPIFFSLTSDFDPADRRSSALKTALYVIVILVIFLFFGRFVLNFFGISLPVLKIAGGLIVANSAWGMVTGSSRMTSEESSEALTKQDISLTPMAMPMLSGPGSIGVVMGLSAEADSAVSYFGMILGIVALGLTVYLCLRLGGPFVKQLGPGAVGAINRIFGFLILAIAVQLIWDGASDFGFMLPAAFFLPATHLSHTAFTL